MGRINSPEVLILNWRDIVHPLGGGAELSLFEHAKAWVKKGATVTWFCAGFNGCKQQEIIEGVHFIRRGSAYTVHISAFIYYVRGWLGKPAVIIDSFHGIPFFTPLYVRRPKIIGLINEVAGKIWFLNTFFPIAGLGFILELVSFIIYRDKDFITASRSTLSALNKKGIPSKNVYVVPHGVTTSQVSGRIVKENTPVIIFLGRIAVDKGINDVLVAYDKILDTLDATLWIVGKEEKPGMFIKIRDESIKDFRKRMKIKYFGYVSQNKKFELLKKSWLLIHPSIKEGWGLNVIEAGTQGTPTVGYDVEGLRDSVVSGRTGVLSAPNPAALAAKIVDILKDDKKRITMGREAKLWSDKFTWTDSTEKSYIVIKKYLH